MVGRTGSAWGAKRRAGLGATLACAAVACGGGSDNTSDVGGFDGLFDGVSTGLNFPLDIGITPSDDATDDEMATAGDVFVANYGTSEVRVARQPNTMGESESFYDGTADGFRGTTGISMPPGDVVWASFEQGGTSNAGGVVVLSYAGDVLTTFDGADDGDAFSNPGGLCWGGTSTQSSLFLVNLGDGTAWRIDVADVDGSGATFAQVGSGLATATLGDPGEPGSPLTNSTNTPEGGARGCAVHDGRLYVADAQNARVIRFDDPFDDSSSTGTPLEDTPTELLTHPTGVAVNSAGDLIVISSDNAHAFVALTLPSGEFVDNGLHDLNVNAGNFGVAVAHNTIWFTRANNRNGTLRAVTPDPDTLPSTSEPFPAQ